MQARLIDFTARDAVKLFAKLYAVKVIGDGIALVLLPRVKEWSQEQKRQRDMRKA